MMENDYKHMVPKLIYLYDSNDTNERIERYLP